MKKNTIFQRHTILSYFILAFTISWVGSYFGARAKYLQGAALEPSDLWLVGGLMLGGPFVAGSVMTFITDGTSGLKVFFARMVKWRVGGRWYLPLLIFPALILLVSLALATFVSEEFNPIFFSIGIPMGLFAGFVEEAGWMGFAYPRMQKKWNALDASVILGLIHALWHVVADFMGNSNIFDSYWLPYFTSFFIFIVALRIIIAWVYTNTGSTLLAQLLHASSTGFLAILVPTQIAPQNWFIFYAVYAIVLWVVAGVIILRTGKSLTKQKEGLRPIRQESLPTQGS